MNSPCVGLAIKVRTLGNVQVLDTHDIDITPKPKKARCLFVLLIFSPKGEMSHEQIASLLWRHHSAEQVRTSLRQSLMYLRRVINNASPELVSADRINVTVDMTRIWQDVQEINPTIQQYNQKKSDQN